jgi:hypothetical protein
MSANNREQVPDDVRKLAMEAANDLHPFVHVSDRTISIIHRAILADRATRPAEPAPDVADLIERLTRQNVCRRCDCISCERDGAGELHDHVCTDGEGCVETREKLRKRVQALRYLCNEAGRALASLQADRVAVVEECVRLLRSFLVNDTSVNMRLIDEISEAIRALAANPAGPKREG